MLSEKESVELDCNVALIDSINQYSSGKLSRITRMKTRKNVKKFFEDVEIYLWYVLRPRRLIRLLNTCEESSKSYMRYLGDWGEVPFEKELRENGMWCDKYEKLKQESMRLAEKFLNEGGKI